MDTIGFNKMDGTSINIARSVINESISGEIIIKGTESYAEACALWNDMIDISPSLIVRVKNEQDVINTVDFARNHGVLLAIKSGGHNIAGKALVNGGVVLDFHFMTDVKVNDGQNTVKVSPGATLAEVDIATQQYGLAVPTGINSTTGIAGLTLGEGLAG